MSKDSSENLGKIIEFAKKHDKKGLRILLSFKSIKNLLKERIEHEHLDESVDDSVLNEVCLGMAKYLDVKEIDSPTEDDVKVALRDYSIHNKSELKIKEYFQSKGIIIQDNPEVQTPSGKKYPDFKVYIDGWVIVEVTNPQLSDRGKESLQSGIAVVGNTNRFQSKVNNEYDRHLRNARIGCPAVIIIDTTGSELGATPFIKDLKMERMPEVSAVVNYNPIYYSYSGGSRLGDVKINEYATHKLTEKQIEILNFKVP